MAAMLYLLLFLAGLVTRINGQTSSGYNSGYPSSSYSGYPSNSYSGYTSNSYSGYPSSSYSGYPSNSYSGYPSSSYSGYPSNSYSGYPSSSYSGYPSNSYSGYPSNYSGYPSSSSGYSGWNSGYPSNSYSGYPSSSYSGYPSNSNSGYPSSSSGYSGWYSGYPSNSYSGYPSSSSGYSGWYSGYPSNSYSGYPSNSYSGYPSSSSGYSGWYSGYPSNSYSGYPSNSYSGYPSNSYSGYPSNSYSGYPSSSNGYSGWYSGYPSSSSGYSGWYSGYPSNSYSGYPSNSYSGYPSNSYSGYPSNSYSGYPSSSSSGYSGWYSGYPSSSYSGYPSNSYSGYPSSSSGYSGWYSGYPSNSYSGYPSSSSGYSGWYSGYPSNSYSGYPSNSYSGYPSNSYSGYPSNSYSGYPSSSSGYSGWYSGYPSNSYSGYPSNSYSGYPSSSSGYSGWYSGYPSNSYSGYPSNSYSGYPSNSYSGYPSSSSGYSGWYSGYPSNSYSGYPSNSYSGYPSSSYSGYPPTSYSGYPSNSYSGYPSNSYSGYPSNSYSGYPSNSYSGYPPTSYSGYPSSSYSGYPSNSYSGYPSNSYSGYPSSSFSGYPSNSYSGYPSNSYSGYPSNFYSGYPSNSYSGYPSNSYSGYPSSSYSGYPSNSYNGYPSNSYSGYPSNSYSGYPSNSYSGYPSSSYSGYPSNSYSGYPSNSYSGYPSNSYSGYPSSSYSGYPSNSYSGYPSNSYSGYPSNSYSGYPSSSYSGYPSNSYSGYPSSSYSGYPSNSYSGYPSNSYSGYPSNSYSGYPSNSYSGYPSSSYSGYPTSTYSGYPSSTYSGYPSSSYSGYSGYSSYYSSYSSYYSGYTPGNGSGPGSNAMPTLILDESDKQSPDVFDGCITIDIVGNTTITPSDISCYMNISQCKNDEVCQVYREFPTSFPATINGLIVSCCLPVSTDIVQAVPPVGYVVSANITITSFPGEYSNEVAVTVLDSTCVNQQNGTSPSTPTLVANNASHCVIDFKCYGDGTPNPNGGNFKCTSGQNPYRWSVALDPFDFIDVNTTNDCNSTSCSLSSVKIYRTSAMYNGVPTRFAKCVLDPMPMNDNYTFGITWYMNGNVDGDPKNLTLAELEHDVDEADNITLTAQYTCRVEIYNELGDKLVDMESEPRVPLEFPANVTFNLGDTVSFPMVMRFPPLCSSGDCYLDVTFTEASPASACSDAMIAFENQDKCGGRVYGLTSFNQTEGDYEMTYEFNMTSLPVFKYGMKNSFTLTAVATVHGKNALLPEGSLTWSNPIQVHVNDVGHWKHAVCWMDPGVSAGTFDGKSYNITSRGQYLLYNHTSLGMEVQVLTEVCDNDFAMCLCGVAVKAGQDVYVESHCAGQIINGFLRKDSDILYIGSKTDTMVKINLPRGTKINILLEPEISVHIIASPFDVEAVEGLCGDLDGDDTNDMPNPSTWSVGAGDSLFTVNTVQALPRWEQDKTMSMCKANQQTTSVNSYKQLCPAKMEEFGTEFTSLIGGIVDGNWDRVDWMVGNWSATPSTVSGSPNITITESNATVAVAEIYNSTFPFANLTSLPVPQTMIDVIEHEAVKAYMATGDITAVQLYLDVLQILVLDFAEMDTDFQSNSNAEYATIQQYTCIGNCYGQGTCNPSTGKCTCYSNFDGSNCDIQTNIPPQTQAPDPPLQSPQQFTGCTTLTTNGSLPTTTCRITEKRVLIGVDLTELAGDHFVLAVYISRFEIQCCLPTSRRRKRSTTQSAATVQSISVSNDGTTYSTPVTITVLDSTCVNYNTTSNVTTLESGYCLISGVCFTNGTADTSDSCNICVTNEAVYDWTRDTGNAACQSSPSSDDDEETKIAVGVTVPLVLILLAVAGVGGFFIYQKKFAKRGKTVRPSNVGLFDVAPAPMKPKITLRQEGTMVMGSSLPSFPPISHSSVLRPIRGPVPRPEGNVPRLNTPEGLDSNWPSGSQTTPALHPTTGVPLPTIGDASRPAVYIEPTITEEAGSRAPVSNVLTVNEQV